MLITDDATLAQHGGLRADDRVDVLPRIAHDRDWSFCSSDVRVADFEGCAPAGRLAHRHGAGARAKGDPHGPEALRNGARGQRARWTCGA
ncbi:hypothetical protein L6V77_24200 [Myxococcota bacterium]|nr:hypothetical protein [Myxococcota bacterium]